MEKVKFGIQILVLALAFPVWFYAEMKMAEKTVKNAQLKSIEKTQVKKVVIIKKAKTDSDNDLSAGFFMKQMVVNN
jgi:hypothetical protein